MLLILSIIFAFSISLFGFIKNSKIQPLYIIVSLSGFFMISKKWFETHLAPIESEFQIPPFILSGAIAYVLLWIGLRIYKSVNDFSEK